MNLWTEKSVGDESGVFAQITACCSIDTTCCAYQLQISIKKGIKSKEGVVQNLAARNYNLIKAEAALNNKNTFINRNQLVKTPLKWYIKMLVHVIRLRLSTTIRHLEHIITKLQA